MTELVLATMQWAKVDDIDETEPLNPDDYECISEIKTILLKYGKLKKFGLTLIHSHFPIEEDEVLVEHVYKTERRLVIEPMKLADADKAVDTQWSLDDDSAIVKCKTKCYIYPPGHEAGHE